MFSNRICVIEVLMVLGAVGLSPAWSAVVPYTITDLGTLGGASGSFAYAVNDSGQVVGHMNGPVFLWDDGVMIELGFTGLPFDINNSTQVAGESWDGWVQAVLWENGSLITLGTFGGPAASARAINDAGQVAGWADTATNDDRAFLWQGGVMTDLGTFGGPQSWAFGINDAGEVVGSAETTVVPPGGLPIRRAFLYSAGTMIPIAGDYSEARDINDAGQVVGTDSTGAFLWDDGVLTALGTLGGYSEAMAVNNLGQVVGRSSPDGYDSAFVWDDGVMYDLNDLIPPDSGWERLQQARDINDAGQIVGWGRLDTGATHGFLLSPIPEPATLTLLGIAAMALVTRRP